MDFDDEDGPITIAWTDADWQSAGKIAGATPKQVEFARARAAGLNQWQAAQQAGYSGDQKTLRTQGSRCDAMPIVQKLISLARASGGGIPDDILNSEESQRMLSQMARAGDSAIKLRSIEILHRVQQSLPEDDKPPVPQDPRETLEKIAQIDPVYAARLAVQEGIVDWRPEGLAALPKCPQCGQIIRPLEPDDEAKPNGVDSEPAAPTGQPHPFEAVT